MVGFLLSKPLSTETPWDYFLPHFLHPPQPPSSQGEGGGDHTVLSGWQKERRHSHDPGRPPHRVTDTRKQMHQGVTGLPVTPQELTGHRFSLCNSLYCCFTRVWGIFKGARVSNRQRTTHTLHPCRDRADEHNGPGIPFLSGK